MWEKLGSLISNNILIVTDPFGHLTKLDGYVALLFVNFSACAKFTNETTLSWLIKHSLLA